MNEARLVDVKGSKWLAASGVMDFLRGCFRGSGRRSSLLPLALGDEDVVLVTVMVMVLLLYDSRKYTLSSPLVSTSLWVYVCSGVMSRF